MQPPRRRITNVTRPHVAGRRRTAARAIVLLVAWLLLVMAGCNGDGASSAAPVVLLVSGDTAGWIVPCGCTSNQSGGLLRRGDYVRRQREEAEVVLVDAGGAASGTSPYDRAKFEAILQGELAMGLAAHNLGGSEVHLGADYLREVSRRLEAPLLSSNLRDAEGALVARPLRIVTAGGRSIALVGVVGQGYAEPGLTIDPPREAILQTIRESSAAYDSLVVLAYLEADALDQLARSLPEADLVVGGPTGQALSPRRLGPTLLASATNKGKFLARFEASPEDSQATGKPTAWQGEIVEMNDAWSDNPRQQQNLEAFYTLLAERDFTAEQTGFAARLTSAAPANFRIAGSASCEQCHPRDCALWRDSPHARAWGSLVEQGAHVDSYCQQCHTTGYGLPGGFQSVSASQDRTSVGCESCHGPSQAHVQRPSAPTAYRGRAMSRCETCHDVENSPQFDADEYWSQIRHGEGEAAVDGNRESGADQKSGADDQPGADRAPGNENPSVSAAAQNAPAEATTEVAR